MARFLHNACVFGLICLLALAAFVFRYRAYVPAPRITTNISLNAKLHLLKERRGQRVDVLAFGSSMTLNNLSSRAVLEALGDSSYLNLGAWGMDVRQCLHLARIVVPQVRPRVVLMVTNMGDFSGSAERFPMDSARITNYLGEWSETGAYLRTRDAGYYLRQMELNAVRMNDPGNYERLVFDRFGGVELEVPPDRVDPDRYNKRPPERQELLDDHYQALQCLAEYLHDRGIRFIVLRSPYRDGLRDAHTDSTLAWHGARLRTTLAAHGGTVCDVSGRSWPDSLFCDYGHMNAHGAYLFSHGCLQELLPARR
ncbi:MAG: hypothetical protein QM724_02345 [Flavobacteriales bacterium]